MNGTKGRNRTDTMSPSRDFESRASTSSATLAHLKEISIKQTPKSLMQNLHSVNHISKKTSYLDIIFKTSTLLFIFGITELEICVF